MQEKLLKKNLQCKKIGENYLFENGVGINDTTFSIYNLCEGISREEIFEEFKKQYNLKNLDIDEIRTDIYKCIDDLIETEVIEKLVS